MSHRVYACVLAACVVLAVMQAAVGQPEATWHKVLPSPATPTTRTLFTDPALTETLVVLGGSELYGLNIYTGGVSFGPAGEGGTYINPGVTARADGEGYLVTVNSQRNAQGQQSLQCFSMSRGGLVWSHAVSFASSLMVDVTQGVVYAEVPVDTVKGFDVRSGTLRGSFGIGGSWNLIAVDDGVAVTMDSTSGSVSAFKAQTGDLLWTTGTQAQYVASGAPSFVGGVLYVNALSGPFGHNQPGAVSLAIDAATGHVVYARGILAETIYNPTVHDGSAYFACVLNANVASGSSVVALSTADGSTRWVYNSTAIITGAVGVDSAHVYLTTSPNADKGAPVFTLMALDRSTGAEAWSFELPAPATPPSELYNFQVSPVELDSGMVTVSLQDSNSHTLSVFAVANSTTATPSLLS